MCGSSPRVRGTRAGGEIPEPPFRFIPARAGNAAYWVSPLTLSSVHPRACGERWLARRVNLCNRGSSPRVRGTPPCPLWRSKVSRFIPARAGNARPVTASWVCVTVHPRACGERQASDKSIPIASGSSPRVRGTPGAWDLPRWSHRFIPARAGNADSISSEVACNAVHPRACGERRANSRRALRPDGSSPRVRGTPQANHSESQKNRFIPARAGNAASTIRCDQCLPVHPRACGERRSAQPDFPRVVGSSPRVRGTLVRRTGTAGVQRFIPARAGNARTRGFVGTGGAVHPRACGER